MTPCLYKKYIKTGIKTISRLKDGVSETNRITEAVYLVSFVTLLEHITGVKAE